MDAENMFANAVKELERMLSSKTVVGEPINVGDATIVPLVSVGFGFGAGGGSSESSSKQGGEGALAAGGGGVRPVALLISDKNGVRLESLKTAGSVLGRVAENVAGMMSRRGEGEGSGQDES